MGDRHRVSGVYDRLEIVSVGLKAQRREHPRYERVSWTRDERHFDGLEPAAVQPRAQKCSAVACSTPRPNTRHDITQALSRTMRPSGWARTTAMMPASPRRSVSRNAYA